jgi:hypothetical protein
MVQTVIALERGRARYDPNISPMRTPGGASEKSMQK